MNKIIAVVGRPNVGKSTLFNKITGRRISIVDNTPGVTRDRIYGDAEWRNIKFTLIDTGGLDKDDTFIMERIREQVNIAIDLAAVIIFVTDLKSGVTQSDIEVAAMLRKSGKNVVLCVNKCDNLGAESAEFYEFYSLGVGDPCPVSSVHGHGTGDLLDRVFELGAFTRDDDSERMNNGTAERDNDGASERDNDGTTERDNDSTAEHDNDDTDEHSPDTTSDNSLDNPDKVIEVAIVGRPNAGKSSLANRIIGEDRSIVSEVAGTTRDAIDTRVTHNGRTYNIIDTAGLRRKSRINEDVEYYSTVRAYAAVDRADVIVMLIDATEGFAEQDSKIAGYAHEKGKPTIIAVNKWDIIDKNDKTMAEFTKKLENDFSFMSYAPFIFVSAKTGQRVDKLFELIGECVAQNTRRITTGKLNELLAYATSRVQPPTDKGKRLKLYYITQPSSSPPAFAVFCNSVPLFHFSYQRYIENQIREAFGLTYTPVRIMPRERSEK